MVLYQTLLSACGHICITKIFGESQQGWHCTEDSPVLIQQEIPVHRLPLALSEGGTVMGVDCIFQEWSPFYLR
jgi:hypothetical protein